MADTPADSASESEWTFVEFTPTTTFSIVGEPSLEDAFAGVGFLRAAEKDGVIHYRMRREPRKLPAAYGGEFEVPVGCEVDDLICTCDYFGGVTKLVDMPLFGFSMRACRAHTLHVWLFGEGDLSFSLAASKLHPWWLMCCTVQPDSLDAEEAVKRNKGMLEDAGHRVDLGVTVTASTPNMFGLPERCHWPGGVARVDLLVFNFPYIAGSPTRSAQLIVDFLQNVARSAEPGTEVLLGLATQKANTGLVAYQYGNKSAEELVAEAVTSSVVSDVGHVLAVQAKQDSKFYEAYVEAGYKHSRHNHMCWAHNDRTAFFLVVKDRTHDASKAFLDSLNTLRQGCPNRPLERVPESEIERRVRRKLLRSTFVKAALGVSQEPSCKRARTVQDRNIVE